MPRRAMGEAPGFSQEARQEELGESLGQSLCWGFPGKARHGRVNSLGLAIFS